MNIPLSPTTINRRAFLGGAGLSLGSAALNMLMANNSTKPRYLLPKARAKRVIFLCMAGGPSHLETFDYKPKLDQLHGQPMPESFTKGQPIAQLQGKELKVQGHLTKFVRGAGKSFLKGIGKLGFKSVPTMGTNFLGKGFCRFQKGWIIQ